MIPNEILVGQHKSWKLVRKLGEGDAGEVYLATAQDESLQAIVKRPHVSAFTSDMARQASQIESEGNILEALKNVPFSNSGFTITTPTLLDRSRAGTGYGEGVFIVIEKAAGVDLNILTRVVRFGAKEALGEEPQFDSATLHFIHRIAEKGEVPQVLLLRALACIIELLQAIHSYTPLGEIATKSGILWNDVKPDHIFWDPALRRFTIIDWGNSQFLGRDGSSDDRRLSRVDDYRQLIEEMGRFLNIASPDLYRQIHWPGFSISPDTFIKNFTALDEVVHELLEEENEKISQLRQEEGELLQSEGQTLSELEKLDTIHKQIFQVGELPEIAPALSFCRRLASQLAFQRSTIEFRWVSLWASRLPSAEEKQWQVFARIAETAGSMPRENRTVYLDALIEGISGNWLEMLWNLLEGSRNDPDINWWQEISSVIRKTQLHTDAATPYRTLQQILQGIQLACKQMEDYESGKTDHIASKFLNQGSVSEQRKLLDRVARRIQEEILPNWKQTSPAPPDSNLEYSAVESVISEVGGILPEAQQALVRVLYQPKAQVKIILDAWESQEFTTASQALRRLLIWDPERKRVLVAEESIQKASEWLSKVRKGPRRGESLLDFAALMEFEGREIRNRVGKADWLDNTLEVFSRLRRGSRPASLAATHPEWTKEILWLAKTKPAEPANAGSSQATPRIVHTEIVKPHANIVKSIQRVPANNKTFSLIQGYKEGEIGEGKDLLLTSPLDTWTPEAQGSSARVLQGFLLSEAGVLKQVAFKLMRLDKIDYAMPLFEEEIQILALLHDVQGITRLVECGFFQPEGEYTFSTEESQKGYRGLSGKILRYGIDSVEIYRENLAAKVEEGWIPYLALEKRPAQENLLMLCDSGHTGGKLLAVSDGLKMAVQICDILDLAHQRGVVYRDHKILHYYWVESYNGIFIIDWNVAKYHKNLPPTEIQHDLVQFGARALHHILTGRTAPGALPLGPTRPEEIEQAANSYHAQWTYDDRRLPPSVKMIIEKILEGGYERVPSLRTDLLKSLDELTK